MEDGKIVIKAQIDDSGLDSGLKEVESKVGKSANSVMNIVKGLSLHDLISKAMGTAVKFAKEVNTATEAVSAKLKGASTLYQGVAVDQNQLLQNLGAIASKTGADLETLGQSVYDALSAGVKPTEDMADVLKVVEASAKLAAGGFTNTSTALSATMKVLNAYSMDIKELDKVQGILMQTQNSGITTVDELGASLAQVVPTAASFGVSFENIGAAIAEMTKQGTKTAQATTALNAIIAELGKNGTNASKNLKAAAEASGMSATSFTDMLDSGMNLAEILEVMSDYAEENGLSMVDMFSSVEAGKGALQLTGQAGDDFNEIMDSMSESAGLVQEAFEKTVDPSQKLSAAWNNLLVTLGTKFKPAADGVRTALADMLTKLSGQYTIADELEGAYDDLETALNAYKKASDEAAGKTDALTIAMVAQRKADLATALWKNSEAYVEASRSLKIYEKNLGDSTKEYNDAMAIIDVYAEKIGETPAKLAEMYESGEGLYNAFLKGYGESAESFMSTYIAQYIKAQEAQKDMIKWEAKQAQATVDEAKFIDSLTKGYIDQNEATMMLLKTYPELEQKVLDNVEAYKALEEAKQGADGAGSGSGGNGGSGGSGDAEKQIDLESELRESLDKTVAKYTNLSKVVDEYGESLFSQEDYVRELKDLYVEYAGKGLGKTSEAMGDIVKILGNYIPEGEKQLSIEERLNKEYAETMTNYQLMAEAGDAFGVQLVNEEDMVRTLTNMYIAYQKEGIDPACDGLKTLISTIETLTGKTIDEVIKADNEVKKLTMDWKEFYKSTSTDMIKTVSSSWGDMAQYFIDSDETIKKLTEDMNRYTEENGLLEQAELKVKEAQAEVNDAIARGDAAAEASARAKLANQKHTLEGYQKEYEALKKNKEAAGSVASGFAVMAKSALESIASILDSLAAQLAALAVANYKIPHLAFEYGAGAVAAGVAAGVARGWANRQKFATGGIVQGNSYTGDNIPIRVNAGELILNMAQQETLARMLESSVALAGLYSSGGAGGGITVNMSGATIYGLSEPEVGKAIYDNIQMLKYEGVI